MRGRGRRVGRRRNIEGGDKEERRRGEGAGEAGAGRIGGGVELCRRSYASRVTGGKEFFLLYPRGRRKKIGRGRKELVGGRRVRDWEESRRVE